MSKSSVMEKLKKINEVFKIFQDKESYFKEISKKQSIGLIGNQILVICIFAFLYGIQLAWNLRPFLGDKHQDFKLFRKYEGNFYTAIIYSIEQLVKKDEPEKNKSSDGTQMKNSTKYELSDSSELIKMFEE